MGTGESNYEIIVQGHRMKTTHSFEVKERGGREFDHHENFLVPACMLGRQKGKSPSYQSRQFNSKDINEIIKSCNLHIQNIL